jgi:C-terminal processing protease CtpA/Prc
MLSLQFGLAAPYTVKIESTEGKDERTFILAGLSVAELEKRLAPRNSKPTLAFLAENSSAILTIPSFREDNDFEGFLRDSFHALRERGTKNLIIDLRENGGGQDLYGMLLYSYLAPAPFRYYASLETRADHFSVTRYDPEFPAEAFRKRLIKTDDGKFLVRQDQHRGLQLQQPDPDRFAGKVLCLIGIVTGSAATEFGAVAQSQNRAVFIGEETAGGYSMDSSGTTLNIVLPKTHAHAFVPTVRYNLAVKPRGSHHGIVPDVIAQASVQDVISGIDRPLQTVYGLIQSGAD